MELLYNQLLRIVALFLEKEAASWRKIADDPADCAEILLALLLSAEKDLITRFFRAK
jgi:predicted component of type VI protein secretion system